MEHKRGKIFLMASAKQFWEQKILTWEKARYSNLYRLYPPSWPLRARLRLASRELGRRLGPGSSVLELGCGSGLLAETLTSTCASYLGLDIAENAIEMARQRVRHVGFNFRVADVVVSDLPQAQVTVFLGLTDWLDEQQIQALLIRLRSSAILFSYTEASALNPYRIYRRYADRSLSRQQAGRTYNTCQVRKWLKIANYSMEFLYKPRILNPGALVWAARQ